MKTKFKFLLAFMALFLIIQSCKEDNIQETNPPKEQTKDTNFVTVEEAEIVASNINKHGIIIGSIEKEKLNLPKYQGLRQINNKVTLSETINKNLPYLYIFNYKDGGFSIVSGDKRTAPILAYCDEGIFKLDSLKNIGMIIWLQNITNSIKAIKKRNHAAFQSIEDEWKSMLCKKNNPNCPPPPPPPTITYGPYTTTSWGQDCSYNADCPLASPSNNGPCGHDYTGCDATAMAQLMYYWAYPQNPNYNWSQMKNNISLTAKLMNDAGVSIGMQYGGNDQGGSSSYPSNISGALKNTFHYHTADDAGFNLTSILTEMYSKRPIILSGWVGESSFLGLWSWATGAGHTWVCDGYQKQSSGYVYLHMNWGWDGSYNGWFSYSDYPTGNGDFKYEVQMVYNIHP